MKSIDDQVHQAYTGQSNKIILENLRLLASDEVTRSKVQMRMPLVSEVNDSWDIIRETAAFYKANGITRVTLLPYHNLGVSKKRNIGGKPVEFAPPSEERVEEIQVLFRNRGRYDCGDLGESIE